MYSEDDDEGSYAPDDDVSDDDYMSSSNEKNVKAFAASNLRIQDSKSNKNTKKVTKQETSNNKKNGIQFMITNRMRNTLEKELGYLKEEVDVMEPQIAAVLIEKSLARPENGMPASWKRQEPGKNMVVESLNAFSSSTKGFFVRLSSAIQKSFKNLVQGSNKLKPIILSVVVVAIGYNAVVFVRDHGVLEQLWKGVFAGLSSMFKPSPNPNKNTVTNTNSKANKKSGKIDAKPAKTTIKSNTKSLGVIKESLVSTVSYETNKVQSKPKASPKSSSNIDLNLLQRVQDQSPMESLKLKTNIVRRKFF